MKKVLNCIICAWIVLVGMSRVVAQKGHDITITVDGFTGEEAYLAYYYWDKQYIEDTVAALDGTFQFEGDEPIQQGIYLVVLPPENNYFELVIGADQEFVVTTDTSDLSGNLQIEGSQENALFYRDIKFLAEQRQKVNALQQQKQAAAPGSAEAQAIDQQIQQINDLVKQERTQMIESNPGLLYPTVLSAMREPEIPDPPVNPDGSVDSMFAFNYYKSHYFDRFPLDDKRLLRTPLYFNKINQYIEQLTYKIPDSINVAIDRIVDRTRGCDECFRTVVGNTLNKYAGSKIMGMDAVYVHMVEQYYMSGDAFWADEEQVTKMEERALAISPTLIGRKAPNITMADSTGIYQNLYNVDADFTILYFWDYDCGHCKKKTPQLAEVYKAYKDKNVALYAVSINGAISEWKKSLRKYGLEGINVQDHERKTGFDAIYDIRSTPRLFVLDADKKILAKHIDVDQLGEILDMFMEEQEGGSR